MLQLANKLSSKSAIMNAYLTKECIRKYSNKKANSQQIFRELDTFKESIKRGIYRETDMQNKVIFSSIALLFGAVGWTIAHTDKRFEQVDKRFEQVDKRFENLEKEVSEIKTILKDMNNRQKLTHRNRGVNV